MGIFDKAKQAALTATVTKALDYLEKDPETNIPKIMEMVDKVTPDDWYAGQRNAIRHSIEAKDNWYQLILRMYQLDAGVRQTFFRNFIVNARQKASLVKYPLILIAPYRISMIPMSTHSIFTELLGLAIRKIPSTQNSNDMTM